MKIEHDKKSIISVSVKDLKLVQEFSMSNDIKNKLDMLINKYPITKLIQPVLVEEHLSELALTSIIEEFRKTVAASLNLNYFGDEKVISEILDNLVFDIIVTKTIVYSDVKVKPYSKYSKEPIETKDEYPSAYLVPSILDVKGAKRHSVPEHLVDQLDKSVVHSAALTTDIDFVVDKNNVRHYPIELYPASKNKPTII